MKALLHKYKHAWVLLYFAIYLVWFFYLNRINIDRSYDVLVGLDEKIPFLEIFIIPYYLWFAYIPLVIGYFFFTSKSEFYRCTAYLFIGMTVCLIVYSIFPNGFYSRPDLDQLGRDNIFIEMTRFIYRVDTGSNACPSIHCFNSIGAWIALKKSERMKAHPHIVRGAFVLSFLICLSTMFVKQHSIVDVVMAFLLGAIMYGAVYGYSSIKAAVQARNNIKKVETAK